MDQDCQDWNLDVTNLEPEVILNDNVEEHDYFTDSHSEVNPNIPRPTSVEEDHNYAERIDLDADSEEDHSYAERIDFNPGLLCDVTMKEDINEDFTVSLTKSGKRQRQESKWKRNVLKNNRLLSRLLPKGPPSLPTCHNSKTLQCKTLEEETVHKFHAAFYSLSTKLLQDSFLLKHIIIKPTARRRPNNNTRSRHRFHLQFKVFKNMVCQKAFLTVLHISRSRVRNVVDKHLKNVTEPTENRGGDRKSKKLQPSREKVIIFLKSLQVESHYCSAKSTRKYLPSELNISKLYKMFCAQDSENKQVKMWLFRQIFNTKFNLSFGSPRTDTCSACLQYSKDVKACTNSNAKTKLMAQKRVHLLKTKAFHSILKTDSPDVLVFSFGFQKNQTLPKLPDQSVYCSKQLCMNNLTFVRGCSSKLTQRNVFSYCLTEEKFQKNPNLVASTVYHKLCNTDFERTSVVRLICDGCDAYIKNRILICMLSKWLIMDAPESIEQIEIIFPVPGHSHLPPDRVFWVIERQIKKQKVIVDPTEYINIYEKVSSVVKVDESFKVYNWEKEASNILKPTKYWHFSFLNSKRLFIKRTISKTDVLVRGEENYKSDLGFYKTVTRKNKNFEDVDPNEIPPDRVLVKCAKLKNVRKLLVNHYGEAWQSNPQLSYYLRFFPENFDESEGAEDLNGEVESSEYCCSCSSKVPELIV